MKTKKIDASLLKKGFTKTYRDHDYYHLYVDGKKTRVFTKISFSTIEINDFLIMMMAKQVKLSKKEFIDLIECPLSKEKYQQILLDKGEVKL